MKHKIKHQLGVTKYSLRRYGSRRCCASSELEAQTLKLVYVPLPVWIKENFLTREQLDTLVKDGLVFLLGHKNRYYVCPNPKYDIRDILEGNCR